MNCRDSPPQPYQAAKKKNCLCFSDDLNAMLASPTRKREKKNQLLNKLNENEPHKSLGISPKNFVISNSSSVLFLQCI